MTTSPALKDSSLSSAASKSYIARTFLTAYRVVTPARHQTTPVAVSDTTPEPLTLLLEGVGEDRAGMDGYRDAVAAAGVGFESRNDACIALLKSSSSLELAAG